MTIRDKNMNDPDECQNKMVTELQEYARNDPAVAIYLRPQTYSTGTCKVEPVVEGLKKFGQCVAEVDPEMAAGFLALRTEHMSDTDTED
ncbi:unnamed protein product [Medioppia subpectinata]|uniref:Uncharacterized protein n=1 Tax=Medioppia subpectinata TaxID=1979941 RepID=A0A7R9Q1C7_9ACAR|nr:unnamed protein product [Medioppia subpectinata]CAG2109073.1 unnamed protein product [Medioppia subpectinata]